MLTSVTGGGKGIGFSISKAFLAEGANVSYCGRSTRGDEFWNFNDAKDGARAVGTKVDLANQDEIKSWVESAAKEFGRIDYIVPNGMLTFQFHFEKKCLTNCGSAATALFVNNPEDWRRSFEAEVLGLVTLIEAAIPHLEKNEGSSIVIVSSLAGWETKHPILTGPYPTIKRAQGHIGKGYSKDLAKKGIRVNTIIPGPIATPNTVRPDGTVELSTYYKMEKDNPEFFASVEKLAPLGRPGQAEEVANAVLFLASPLAGFTTGSSLVLDGGISEAYY